MVSAGPSQSNRDVDQPWYGLMQALGDGSCPSDRGIVEATRFLESSGDGCWGLPLALVYWSQKWHQSVVMYWSERTLNMLVHIFLYCVAWNVGPSSSGGKLKS